MIGVFCGNRQRRFFRRMVMLSKSQLVFKAVDILCYQMQNHVHFPLIEQVPNVPYSDQGGRATSGNIFYDKNRMASGVKFPIIVNIHGGGFVMGDKDYRESLCEFYAHNGYFVFDINYRMPPDVVFPVLCNDCIDALNFLPVLAKEYPIDLDKIIVTGDSSGGYLTAYVAALAYDDELRKAVGGHELQVNLAAIAPFCGIYDVQTLTSGTLPPDLIQDTASMLFGYHVDRKLNNLKDYPYIQYVAPIDYVNANWCPVFIAWAEDDLICVGQGAVMEEKLRNTCKTVESYHCGGLLNNHCYHLNFQTLEAKKCMAAFLRFLKSRV